MQVLVRESPKEVWTVAMDLANKSNCKSADSGTTVLSGMASSCGCMWWTRVWDIHSRVEPEHYEIPNKQAGH